MENVKKDTIQNLSKWYRNYKIKHGEFGWFGVPAFEDCNKDRWGYTPLFNSRIEVEAWIDEH